MPHDRPPDIVLLGTEWQPRALIRAQLIEEGFEVVATDTWPMMRRQLRSGSKPLLAIVDLKSLPDPENVLSALRAVMQPARVLVLAALGTLPVSDIEAFGFRTLSRPIAVQEIVEAAGQLISLQTAFR